MLMETIYLSPEHTYTNIFTPNFINFMSPLKPWMREPRVRTHAMWPVIGSYCRQVLLWFESYWQKGWDHAEIGHTGLSPPQGRE